MKVSATKALKDPQPFSRETADEMNAIARAARTPAGGTRFAHTTVKMSSSVVVTLPADAEILEVEPADGGPYGSDSLTVWYVHNVNHRSSTRARTIYIQPLTEQANFTPRGQITKITKFRFGNAWPAYIAFEEEEIVS